MRGITIIKRRSKAHTPEYWVWHAMKQRCLSRRHPNYKHYGARGVRVCKIWLGKEGFANFLSDMGNRPLGKTKGGRAKYSLSRVNNALLYSRSTCVWATQKEQCAPGQRRPKTKAMDRA